MAIPNALLTFIAATLLQPPGHKDFQEDDFNEDGTSNAFITKATSEAASSVMAAFTVIMVFILYNRSRTSYNRWWEGGTLLQKTRGEWFNAYSSIMAFTSTKPELQEQVESYVHLVARLFSLLMCCGLQQVSPHRDRPFEIIDLAGIEPESMEFLNSAPDKVEVILQWIQRSMVLHMGTGVLPVSPPVLSRAFQEVSRGIVNLQNARKIADFPYPYPLAQMSMILQLIHWVATPMASAVALPRAWAVLLAFSSIFVLWSIHFNALDLEFPFGSRVNDLPMNEFQQEWNNSIITLLDQRAQRPPIFKYEAEWHVSLNMVMSDASELYVPMRTGTPQLDKGSAVITIAQRQVRKGRTSRNSRTIVRASSNSRSSSNQMGKAPSEPSATEANAPPSLAASPSPTFNSEEERSTGSRDQRTRSKDSDLGSRDQPDQRDPRTSSSQSAGSRDPRERHVCIDTHDQNDLIDLRLRSDVSGEPAATKPRTSARREDVDHSSQATNSQTTSQFTNSATRASQRMSSLEAGGRVFVT